MKEQDHQNHYQTRHYPIVVPTENHFSLASGDALHPNKINNSLQFTFNLEGGES